MNEPEEIMLKKYITVKIALLSVVSVCLLFFFCSAPLKQFYPDTFFEEDAIYENHALRFSLRFRGNWNIITDPTEMSSTYQAFAKTLQKAGGELLFMGSTVEELYGVKALAINLNEPPLDYAGYIRDLNQSEVQDDMEPVEFIAGEHLMAKWVYDKSGYRFVEFFFVVDTYDIRLSFWTKPELFVNFLPVFEETAASLTLTAGF